MIGWLLFISFLLHAFSFYWIFHLKQRTKETSEIEGMLAAYTEEMKEENDKLIRQMKTFGENLSQTNEATSFPNAQKDENVENSSEHEWALPVETEPTENVDSAVSETDTAPVEEDEEKSEKSLEAQALSLAEEGLKQDEIAKKLGRGKGEIELLLRLSKVKGSQSNN